MYWYKKTKIAVIALAITALSYACSSESTEATKQVNSQLNIPAFFTKEIAALQKRNPAVVKTVKKDSVSETKTVHIENWTNELASFAAVDLNKPAYAGFLKKDSVAGVVTYTSTKPSLDIKSVRIQYTPEGTLSELRMEKQVDNLLYRTEETLIYFPNKRYELKKKQHVLLLGDKYYHIAGAINPS